MCSEFTLKIKCAREPKRAYSISRRISAPRRKRKLNGATNGLHWEAITAAVASLLPPVVNLIVKDLIRRPRPTADLVHVFKILDSYSFPSGHVMFYVGFFGFIWFLVFTILKHSLKRTFLLVGLGILIGLIGVSRIYLGQHWASDVLGAYLLGSLTLVAILRFYRWGKKRFFVHQPVAPHEPASTQGPIR